MTTSAKVNGISYFIDYSDSRIDNIYAVFGLQKTIKQLAEGSGADVAGNLSYAEYKITGRPIGRNIVDGKVVTQDIEKTFSRDSLYMLPDGTMAIGRPPAGVKWSLQGSPPLLDNGVDVVDKGIERDQLGRDIWANNAKHLRIAYGLKSPYELVIVRTRDEITLKELAAIMKSLGCIDAINGDGGGSTTLYPIDNGIGRKLGAALCIKKGIKKGVAKPMELTIKQDFIPKGRKNRSGYALKPEKITIHLTGNKAATADAENHAEYLKGDTANGKPVSWHFTVDDHPTVYQHLPTNENGWHAGDGPDGPGNRTTIAIEVCEYEGINQEQAWLNAAKLTAKEMLAHNLKITDVVQHNKWSGKNCPEDLRANGGTGWKKFIENVAKERKALDPLPQEKPTAPKDDITGHWAEDAIRQAIKDGVLSGYSDGTFRPDEPLTRAQYAVIRLREKGGEK